MTNVLFALKFYNAIKIILLAYVTKINVFSNQNIHFWRINHVPWKIARYWLCKKIPFEASNLVG